MYELIILPNAQRELERLDPPIRRRVSKRLDWVVQHFDEIQPEPLKANLADLFKIRIGDYRVLYQFDRTAHTITVVRIRHRREVYE